MDYLEQLDVPDLNEERLLLFMRNELGLPVNQEIIEREIVRAVITGKLFFHRRGALQWSERQEAPMMIVVRAGLSCRVTRAHAAT
ncbi:MAG: hypothetical protein QOH60_3772 [Mycobacterium sp.]|jgi:hypothetical protein|nr:hypothetical protein [Mycobacterium sp.]